MRGPRTSHYRTCSAILERSEGANFDRDEASAAKQEGGEGALDALSGKSNIQATLIVLAVAIAQVVNVRSF